MVYDRFKKEYIEEKDIDPIAPPERYIADVRGLTHDKAEILIKARVEMTIHNHIKVRVEGYDGDIMFYVPPDQLVISVSVEEAIPIEWIQEQIREQNFDTRVLSRMLRAWRAEQNEKNQV